MCKRLSTNLRLFRTWSGLSKTKINVSPCVSFHIYLGSRSTPSFLGMVTLFKIKNHSIKKIMYGLWPGFLVRKKLKLKESDLTLRGFCFFRMFLKNLRKTYSRLVWLPAKTINVIQSFNFQLYAIIIDYLFKVSWSNAKTMFWLDINKSIFLDKVFQSYLFGKKKDLFKFFLNFLWILSPRNTPS